MNIVKLLILMLFSVDVLSDDTVKVYIEDLPPNVIINGDSTKGRAIEIIKQLEIATGLTFELIRAPWARAYYEGITKANIMFTGLVRLPKREDHFLWLYQLSEDDRPFIWALKNNAAINYKKGLYAFTRRDQKLSQFRLFAEEEQFKPNLYIVTSRDQAMEMLFAKRVDLIVGSENYIKRRAIRLGLNAENLRKIKEMDIESNSLFIALSNKTPIDTVNKIKTGFDELKNSGKLNKINLRWLNEDET